MAEFLGESIEAVLLSAHVEDELFAEFRAVAPVDTPPKELLESLQSRWGTVSERVESHVASNESHVYGRMVINRLPRLLAVARDDTGGGVEGDAVVLDAYLPAAAAHNLLMGVELTLAELPADGAVAANLPAPKTATAAEALARSISLSFP